MPIDQPMDIMVPKLKVCTNVHYLIPQVFTEQIMLSPSADMKTWLDTDIILVIASWDVAVISNQYLE
jgi:hypothetical protein